MARMFLAIDLPEPVREALRAIQPETRGIKPTEAENFHLTLKFLGEVEGDRKDRVVEALDAVPWPRRFILSPGGVGQFPQQGPPKVLFVGFFKTHPHLFALKKRVEDALFNVGFEPDKRVYQPHLTLARITEEAQPEDIRAFLRARERFLSPPFAVDRFYLMESIRRGGNLVYTREEAWDLPD